MFGPIALRCLDVYRAQYSFLFSAIFIATIYVDEVPKWIMRHKAIVTLCWIQAVLTFAVTAENETIDFRSLIILPAYVILVGVHLAKVYRRDGGTLEAVGFLAFAAVLAFCAFQLVKAAGPDNILRMQDGELFRQNPDYEVQYLWILRSANVAIGIVPATIFGLACSSLLLVRAQSLLAIAGVLVACAAAFVNALVATRTALIAAACGLFAVGGFAVLRLKRGRWAVVAGLALMMVAITYVRYELPSLLDPIAHRFFNIEQESRFEIWAESWDLLRAFPFGGGGDALTTHLWAHNLLLDIGLSSGIFALLTMSGLLAIAVLGWFRWLPRGSCFEHPLGVLLLSTFVSLMAASMSMPPQFAFVSFLLMVGVFASEMASEPENAGNRARTAVSMRRVPQHNHPVVSATASIGYGYQEAHLGMKIVQSVLPETLAQMRLPSKPVASGTD